MDGFASILAAYLCLKTNVLSILDKLSLVLTTMTWMSLITFEISNPKILLSYLSFWCGWMNFLNLASNNQMFFNVMIESMVSARSLMFDFIFFGILRSDFSTSGRML
jgi:hypothetical protein